MRGTVTKKGNKWCVVVELAPDPLTGKRRQQWHSGFKTLKEAERARIDLLSKLDRGEYVEPSRQTLADYLVEWLTAIEHTVRPSTFDSYKRNMHNHVIDHIGTTPLARVDAVTLNGLYGMLLTSGRRRPSQTGRGYSPEIVDRAIELRGLEFSLTETAAILQAEFEEAAALNKNTLNSLLRRRAAAPAVADEEPKGLDRRTVNYIHTILHRALKDAVRWSRLARNPADADDPRRGGAKSMASMRGTQRHSAHSSTPHASRTTGTTHCGCCSPRRACDEARRLEFAGAISTSTPADCEWCRGSRKYGARSPSASRRRRRVAVRSRSTTAQSPCCEPTAS